MPWKETCLMDERIKFVGDCLKDEWSVAELCRYYGISRKTGYKWIERYQVCGMEGLGDMSRAPRYHPNATPATVEDRIVGFRHEHPHWGPRKLIHRLRQIQPAIAWPAVSTAGAILKRHGLAVPRRRRARTPASPGPRMTAKRPNDVWAADFKGWFRTQDGTRMDPLTISDAASRYLIRCRGLVRPNGNTVRAQFELAFREFGLPWTIRTDNGSPFASVALGGLSQLSVWWIRLGIIPERIQPGHPEQNGRHERLHRSLKQATAKPPQAHPRAQQAAFDAFRREYNEDRPHEALDMNTPAQCYRPSERSFPARLPEVYYGPEFVVRRVRSNGEIKWEGDMLYLSEALVDELVGLRPIDKDCWEIHFGPVPLAIYDSLKQTLQPISIWQKTEKVSPMCPDQSVTLLPA